MPVFRVSVVAIGLGVWALVGFGAGSAAAQTGDVPEGIETFDGVAREVAKVGDTFEGNSADMSGDRVVFGSVDRRNRQAYNRAGTATLDDAGVVIELTPDRFAAGFSSDVAIEGDVVVVGAFGDDLVAPDGGSVFVFERGGDGTWSQTANFAAADTALNDRFGRAVGLSNGRIVVGASGDNGAQFNTGAVYVFERDPVTDAWVETAKIVPDDTVGNDNFGLDIGLDGDLMVVGGNGIAGFYEYDSGTGDWRLVEWERRAETQYRPYGQVVDISGNRAIVGGASPQSRTSAIGVWQRSAGGEWVEDFSISRGFEAAIGDGFVVIGAWYHPDGASFEVWGLEPRELLVRKSNQFTLDYGVAIDGTRIAGLRNLWDDVWTCGGQAVTTFVSGTVELDRSAVVIGSAGPDDITASGGSVCSGGGDDTIHNAGTVSTTVFAGDGDDTVSAATTVDGGAGADTISGSPRADSIDGGDGDDVIDGGEGDDSIDGGDGDDVIDGGDGNDEIDGGDGADVINGEIGEDVLFGGPGDDTIDGGLWDDLISGGPGTDILTGNGGDDLIYGGPGTDILTGNGGSDTVSYADAAGSVVVTLDGVANDLGVEDDKIDATIENVIGSAFGDLLVGNEQDNVLTGGPGPDTMRGRGGDDTIVAGDGFDLAVGGSGQDTATYSGRRETPGWIIMLESDTDVAERRSHLVGVSVEIVVGSRDFDRIIGNSGDNTIYGGGGDDYIEGGDGDDVLNASGRVLGGPGSDTITAELADYSGAPGPVTMSPEGAVTDDGYGDADRLVDVVNIRGSAYDDVLFATGRFSSAFGGPGDDLIRAVRSDGFITLSGGPGDDHIIGGPGRNRILGDEGNDLIDGGGGSDSIYGGPGDDTVIAVDGERVGSGGAGFDRLSFAQATEGVSLTFQHPFFEVVIGSNFDDRFKGSYGDEVFLGGGGDDTFFGGGGDDTLLGGGGDDELWGGPGNDTVVGGAGADRLSGGLGDGDVVDYSDSSGPVRVSLNGATDDGGSGEGDFVEPTFEVVIGSAFADVLVGSSSGEALFGGAGDDVIFARGGDDMLDGGGGDDELWGGSGDDTLVGGPGADRLSGGLGDADVVDYSGSSGPVRVSLNGAANDGMAGEGDFVESTIEIVIGSAFDDVLVGSNNGEVLRGEAGNDTIYARGGSDSIFGGPGTDLLHGGADTDTCTDPDPDTTFTLCEVAQP